jgi:hypothetical protein
LGNGAGDLAGINPGPAAYTTATRIAPLPHTVWRPSDEASGFSFPVPYSLFPIPYSVLPFLPICNLKSAMLLVRLSSPRTPPPRPPPPGLMKSLHSGSGNDRGAFRGRCPANILCSCRARKNYPSVLPRGTPFLTSRIAVFRLWMLRMTCRCVFSSTLYSLPCWKRGRGAKTFSKGTGFKYGFP